jgi:hypothetical protein
MMPAETEATEADELLLMLRCRPDLIAEVQRLRAAAAAAQAATPSELDARRELVELRQIAKAARLIYAGENAWLELGAALGATKAPF